MVDKIAVIGGDMRQSMLAELLADSGYTTVSYGMGQNTPTPYDLKSFDAIILPMPVTTDGVNINAPLHTGSIALEEVMSSVRTEAVVLGGKLPLSLVKKYKQLSFYDYLEREDFAVKNSVATAEGALAIAINETPHTIWNSRCLVTGFGRISKTLVRMLMALGARVDVAARKCSDRAWAHTLSCGAFDIAQLGGYISDYDLVFNTVPEKILNAAVLKNTTALIIDLASKPGGGEFLFGWCFI